MFPDFSKSVRKPGSGVNAPLDAEGHTALHLAVTGDDLKTLESLLRIGANPNQQDKNGQSPLFEAVRRGSLAMAERLVTAGARFTQLDDKKRSALDWAIEQQQGAGFIEALKTLGADPFAAAPASLRTPLHLAAENNNTEIVAYLAGAGAALNAQDKEGATPLHAAVAAGSFDAAQRLLALGADPLIRNNQIETPLHLAARRGDAALTDLLLAEAEVRRTVNEFKTYADGFTPLMTAAKKGHAAIVEKLAAVGGDVNQTDNQRRHSLVIAIEGGDVETARLLIELGADTLKAAKGGKTQPLIHDIGGPNYAQMLLLLYTTGFDLNAPDSSGQTALHKACDQQDKDKIRALLALGANPNIANAYGRRPLDTIMDHYSFSYMDHSEIIGMLLSKGASPNISPSPTMSSAPLHIAARNGNIKCLELILAQNPRVDVAERGDGGMTPFMAACDSGRDEAAKLLKKHGADPARKDRYGRGALHFAARGGSVKLLRSFLHTAALSKELDAVDNKGRTPLHHACEKGQDEAAVFLMTKGARIDVQDNEGFTPLHRAVENYYMPEFLDGFEKALGARADWNLAAKNGETLLHTAVRNGQQPVLERLVTLGADILKKDGEGRTPLLAAVIASHDGMVEYLCKTFKEREIALDRQRDANGWTALHHAAGQYSAGIAQHLVEAGADVNARGNDGVTPLLLAVRAGQSDVVEHLLKNGADINAADASGETVFDIALKAQDKEMLQMLIANLSAVPDKNPGGKPTPPGISAP